MSAQHGGEVDAGSGQARVLGRRQDRGGGVGEGPQTRHGDGAQGRQFPGGVIFQFGNAVADQAGEAHLSFQIGQLEGADGFEGDVAFQDCGQCAPQLAQQRPLRQGSRDCAADDVVRCRPGGRQVAFKGVQPCLLGAAQEFEEDRLAGLEVADDVRLRQPDPATELAQADLRDRHLTEQGFGRVENRLLANLDLFRSPGPLEGGALGLAHGPPPRYGSPSK